MRGDGGGNSAIRRFRALWRGQRAGEWAARRGSLNAHAGAENGGEIGGGDGAHAGANGDGVRCGCGRKKEGKKKKRGGRSDLHRTARGGGVAWMHAGRRIHLRRWRERGGSGLAVRLGPSGPGARGGRGRVGRGFRPKGGWGFLIVLSIDLIPVIHLGFRK